MADKDQLFTRIPFQLNDAFEAGDITAPMLVVMNYLHRHAKWSTGVVQKTSAPFIALAFSSADAWKTDTVKDALRRLETQGYITRHMTLGSKKPYAITINNYLAVINEPVMGKNGKLERDPDGKLVYNQKRVLINPREIKGCHDSDSSQSPDDHLDNPPDDPPDDHRNTRKNNNQQSPDRDDIFSHYSQQAKESNPDTDSEPAQEIEIESEIDYEKLMEECLAEQDAIIEEAFK